VIYIDTSIIVKLYIKEELSFEASHWVKKNNEAIPLTGIHELEFINAIYLKHSDQKLQVNRFSSFFQNSVHIRKRACIIDRYWIGRTQSPLPLIWRKPIRKISGQDLSIFYTLLRPLPSRQTDF
jgi:hypothetical protein